MSLTATTTMPATTPADLSAKGSDVRFDLSSVPAPGSPRREKAKVLVAPLCVGRHPVNLTIKGTLTTDGITHLAGTFGDNYSFGLRVAADEDQTALEELLQKLSSQPLPGEEGTEWETRDLFKNGVLYLKCKTDTSGKKFDFTSNVKLTPKKKNEDLVRDMPVTVVVKPAAYYSLETKTDGISLALVHAEFTKAVAEI